jgi:hypothetical protein
MKVCWVMICLLLTTALWSQVAPDATPAQQSNQPMTQPATPVAPAALPNHQ